MSDMNDSDTNHSPLPEHVRKNRAKWEATSTNDAIAQRSPLRALAWGLWRIPEADLQVLGEVAGTTWGAAGGPGYLGAAA